MTHAVYFDNTDSVLKLLGLHNNTGAYENAATVTLEALEHRGSGDAVAGVTLPLAMVYQSGSDGDYYGAIPAALDVAEGDILIATIKAISGPFQAEWVETVRVKNAVI